MGGVGSGLCLGVAQVVLAVSIEGKLRAEDLSGLGGVRGVSVRGGHGEIS